MLQVAEDSGSKTKDAAQQTYRTATEYGSAAYDKVGLLASQSFSPCACCGRYTR